MSDRPIRTQGEPSYGVTLHYDAAKTKVSARSHVPYVWVNSDQFHVDKSTYLEATPVGEGRAGEFTEYFTAMTCTINRIDEEIAALTARRDALQNHMNESMMLGSVSKSEVAG